MDEPDSWTKRLIHGWDYLRIVFTIHWFGFLYYTFVVFFSPMKEFTRLVGSSEPSPSGLELMYFVGGLRLFIQLVLGYAIVVNEKHVRYATIAGMMVFEGVFFWRFIAQSGFGAIDRYWPPLIFLLAYAGWLIVTLLRIRKDRPKTTITMNIGTSSK